MQLTVKALSKQTSIYGVFQLVQRLVSVAVIPLYSHYLTPAEFGSLDILYLIVWFIGIVGGSKLDAAFIRYYGDAKTAGAINTLLSSSILCMLCFATSFCALAAIGAKPILEFMYSSKGLPLAGFYLALVATWLELVGSLALAYLRVNHEARLVGSISLTRAVIGAVVSVSAVTVFKLGTVGILIGAVAGGLVLVGTSYWIVLRRTPLTFRLTYASALYKYALPMLPAPMFMYVLNYADRYYLLKYWSLDDVGIYAMGYKFAMLISMLIMGPFGEMWGTNQFALYHAGQKETYQRLSLIYVSLLYLGALCVTYASYEVTMIAFDQTYYRLLTMVAPLAVGVAIWGIVPTLDFGCLLHNKTWIRSITTGFAALSNILLNVVLIPRFGGLGAALATLLSFVVLTVVTYLFNRRLTDYCVDINKVFFLTLLLGAFAALFYLEGNVSYLVFCLVRVAAVGLFLYVLLHTNGIRIQQLIRPSSLTALVTR